MIQKKHSAKGGMNVRPHIGLGYRIGSLTVEEKTSVKKNGYNVWRCRCDCGGMIELDTRYLQRGTITDCGCMRKPAPGRRDLTGKRFGMLLCISAAENDEHGYTQWNCLCDCGNTCKAATSQLTAGYKKSCGCLKVYPMKEYIGQRFGKLLVISYDGKKNGMHRWKCRCDCGSITSVGQTLLQSGKTKSCGCIRSEQVLLNAGNTDGSSAKIIEYYRKQLSSRNKSGCTGVYKNEKSGVWIAQITFRSKTYYLGSYEQYEDAVKARKLGEEMHDQFLAWYYQTHMIKKNEVQNIIAGGST